MCTNKVLLQIWNNIFLYLFKPICISLVMMKISHPWIWPNLGVILWTYRGINDLNIISLLMNLCAIESATLSKPPLSDGFIVSFCRSLTEISLNVLVKTYFWLDSWFETVTPSLEKHGGLALVWESIHSKIYSPKTFVIVLNIYKSLIDFRVILAIMDISTLILCPLLD